MPFGRLHEEAAGDSKLLALSDAAWRMWGMGLIYCQKNLTDGFIPEHAITTFGVRGFDWRRLVARIPDLRVAERLSAAIRAWLLSFIATPEDIASELCTSQVPGKAAVWERVTGGYQVHDYLDWNDSKAEILKARADGRDRIKRWREEQQKKLLQQQVQVGVQNSEPSDVRNTLQTDERHAHASGTWYVESSSEGVQGEPSADPPANRRHQPERRRPPSVLDGTLPRDHVTHAECSRNFAWCVPAAVHQKLVSKLSPRFAGDRQAADRELRAWYPKVWGTLSDDFVMPDAFRFWEGRFDSEFATKTEPVSRRPEVISSVPSASATRQKYLAEDRP